MKKKPQWSWDKWVQAMESCSLLSDRDRDLAVRFRRAFKRRGQWIGPWEIRDAPDYVELVPLQLAGFAYMNQGFFIPCIDPLPEKDSIETTPAMNRLLRLLLRGRNLYRINEPGYITSKNDLRRWVLRNGMDTKELSLDESCAQALFKARLIKPDGCGHGWPFQWTSRFRPDRRRLCGVKGFRKPNLAWLFECIERSNKAARKKATK